MSKKKRFFQIVKRVAKLGGLGFLILLIILLIPLVRAGIECRYFSRDTPPPEAVSVERQAVTAGLSNYRRSEEQTYLTLPEWYIVYSADEYAAFIAENPPSHFPYFTAIGQYWRSYYQVCAITRDEYPLNGRYQTILAVIGTSFTLENIVKGVYENSIGRVTEWLSSADLTEEDAYARQVAKEYGDFIHTIPWFEFPFKEKLRGLWTETSLWGPNVIRKWERKFALSLEYGGKALYARLIKGGNEASFTPQDVEIQVWAEDLSKDALAQEPDVRLVQPIDNTAAIAVLPRYEAFTQLLPRLAQEGVEFVEIAGNDEIMITVIAPDDWTNDLGAGDVLLEMPVLSQPGFKRVAVNVPVTALHTVLIALEDDAARLEHVYDY